MYIAIFLAICVSTLMYRVAEREKRRPWLWAAMTVVVLVLLSQMTLSPAVVAIIGLVVMFALMTLANIFLPVNKGPF